MSRSQPDKAGAGRKQFLLLDGSPILIHTLRKFAASPSVHEIVVALPADNIDFAREFVEKETFASKVRFVEGGETRQQSVENALAALSPGANLVAVHDGVRPFVSIAAIEKVFEQAAQTGAAILGIVPVDTVKQVHLNRIRATIPRDRLVLAQTPQVFRYDLLKRAFEAARMDNFIGTDEASLVERLDEVEVSVVPGSDRNIKITKPSDMDLARLYLAQEREA